MALAATVNVAGGVAVVGEQLPGPVAAAPEPEPEAAPELLDDPELELFDPAPEPALPDPFPPEPLPLELLPLPLLPVPLELLPLPLLPLPLELLPLLPLPLEVLPLLPLPLEVLPLPLLPLPDPFPELFPDEELSPPPLLPWKPGFVEPLEQAPIAPTQQIAAASKWYRGAAERFRDIRDSSFRRLVDMAL